MKFDSNDGYVSRRHLEWLARRVATERGSFRADVAEVTLQRANLVKYEGRVNKMALVGALAIEIVHLQDQVNILIRGREDAKELIKEANRPSEIS